MSGLPPSGSPLIDWWVEQTSLRMAVVKAARTYADCTHGNLRGQRYRHRQEARDALQDALEALDEAEAKHTGLAGW